MSIFPWFHYRIHLPVFCLEDKGCFLFVSIGKQARPAQSSLHPSHHTPPPKEWATSGQFPKRHQQFRPDSYRLSRSLDTQHAGRHLHLDVWTLSYNSFLVPAARAWGAHKAVRLSAAQKSLVWDSTGTRKQQHHTYRVADLLSYMVYLH